MVAKAFCFVLCCNNLLPVLCQYPSRNGPISGKVPIHEHNHQTRYCCCRLWRGTCLCRSGAGRRYQGHYADREKHKTGPHLVNLIGRTAGSLEDYKKYSKAMKASGIVWDEETLIEYLRAPKKYIKGTKMAFVGLKKDADIENVIAYLMAEK